MYRRYKKADPAALKRAERDRRVSHYLERNFLYSFGRRRGNNHVCLVCRKAGKGLAVCCGRPTTSLGAIPRVPRAGAGRGKWARFLKRFIKPHRSV
jgi:hypothetical protein